MASTPVRRRNARIARKASLRSDPPWMCSRYLHRLASEFSPLSFRLGAGTRNGIVFARMDQGYSQQTKVIYDEVRDVSPPGMDGVEYSIKFRTLDPELDGTPEALATTRENRIVVSASRSRLAAWRLSPANLAKVLFWFAKRHVSHLVTTGTLPTDGFVRMPMITTYSQPDVCPFDPAAIPEAEGYTVIERLMQTKHTDSLMKPRIFISYARPDLLPAKGVVRFLKSAGFQTWFDYDDLHAGQDWRQVIKREIANCRLLLLCLSTNSVDRTGFFQKEMRLAIEQAELRPASQTFIVPLRLNECLVPDAVNGWQTLDLFALRATDRLLAAISHATAEDLRAPISAHEDLINAISDFNRE